MKGRTLIHKHAQQTEEKESRGIQHAIPYKRTAWVIEIHTDQEVW